MTHTCQDTDTSQDTHTSGHTHVRILIHQDTHTCVRTHRHEPGHTHVRTHTHVSGHTHVRTLIHECQDTTRVRTHTRVLGHTHVSGHTRVRTLIHECQDTHTCVRTQTRVRTHTHTSVCSCALRCTQRRWPVATGWLGNSPGDARAVCRGGTHWQWQGETPQRQEGRRPFGREQGLQSAQGRALGGAGSHSLRWRRPS